MQEKISSCYNYLHLKSDFNLVIESSESICMQLIDTIIDSHINDKTGKLKNIVLTEVENQGGVTTLYYQEIIKVYTKALKGKKNTVRVLVSKKKNKQKQP